MKCVRGHTPNSVHTWAVTEILEGGFLGVVTTTVDDTLETEFRRQGINPVVLIGDNAENSRLLGPCTGSNSQRQAYDDSGSGHPF